MGNTYSFRKKMVVGGKLGEAKLFIDEVIARNSAIKVEDVRLALRMAQLGETAIEFPEGTTNSYITAIKSIASVAKEAYKKADKFIEEEKKREIAEAAKEEAYKEKCIEVYKATDSTALAKPMSELVDQSVALALGDHFIMKDGDITIKEGQDVHSSFGSGFKNLNDLYATSSELQDGFAVYEAKLGLAAKKALGNGWPIVLAGATKKEIIRIRKNMYAVEKLQKMGAETHNIPIMTIRTLTEVRYSEDDVINEKLSKETLETFFKKSKEKGSWLTQQEARQLVQGAKTFRTFKSLWDYFYLTIVDGAITVKGSMGLSDEEFDKSTLVIERKTCTIITKDPDGYQQEDIPTIVGEPSQKAAAKQVEDQKAKTPSQPQPVVPVAEPVSEPQPEPALAPVIPFQEPVDPNPLVDDEPEDDLDDIFKDLV